MRGILGHFVYLIAAGVGVGFYNYTKVKVPPGCRRTESRQAEKGGNEKDIEMLKFKGNKSRCDAPWRYMETLMHTKWLLMTRRLSNHTVASAKVKSQ